MHATSHPARRRTAVAALAALFTLAACSGGDGGGATGPSTNNGASSTTPAAISVESGSGQLGTPGSALAQPLVVRVTNAAGDPVAGRTVTFAVTSGTATVSPTSTTTDASGRATASLTLGAGTAAVQVTATVQGTTLVTTFSATPTSGQLTVSCTGADGLTLAVGKTAELSTTSACLDGGPVGAEYAIVAFNSAADAKARASVTVMSNGVSPATSPLLVRGPSNAPTTTRAPLPSDGGFARTRDEAFEHALRERNARELAPLMPVAREWAASRAPGARRAVIPGNVATGTLVTLNANGNVSCGSPDLRVGRVEAVSQRAIVVADTLNPLGGYTTAEYQAIAVTFDTLVDAVDTRNFGQSSDIDGNGRVILFFTSAVNALTPRLSSSYIGGFFDSRDLFPLRTTNGLPGCAGSNQAELFYLLVPDPSGQVNGNKFSKTFVSTVTVSTVAHEYEHLINSSRRLFVNTSSTAFETVWLDEGLAHVAEELLFYARVHLTPMQNIGAQTLAASPLATNAFGDDAIQNFDRLTLYLENPLRNSPYADNDSLETRGATWAFLRYAADRVMPSPSQETLWQRLVNTTTIGMANLQQAYGTDVPTLFKDWATTLLLDDVGNADARHQFPSWNLRSMYSKPILGTQGQYPLSTISLGTSPTPTTVTIPGGSAGYLRFAVAAGRSGGVSWTAPPAGVTMTIARLK